MQSQYFNVNCCGATGQATTDRRADVRRHQPGPREEDGHHREPPAPSPTRHVFCPPLQVRKTNVNSPKLPCRT